ncbi:hypothetical protein AVEN_10612-1 [Araneus ventricosus]|uniref:Uncharacterized protein n=1 Tax=Araneus ventricosus TaxID=182803 RepID=A0A4Y2KZY3_ARAVE|nr:hypothetical protein AVEN_10612-1 [Araneus ventricosus]
MAWHFSGDSSSLRFDSLLDIFVKNPLVFFSKIFLLLPPGNKLQVICKDLNISVFTFGRGRGSKVCQGSKPYSTEDHCTGYCTLNHTLPAGKVWKFGEGVPTKVSSSSSDRASILRGPSQNNPCVVSKRGLFWTLI